MARPAAVAEQVDVKLELLPLRRQLERAIMKLVAPRAGAEQAEPGTDARDVRVHGDVALAEGEQQHARGRLAADAGQRGQLGAALLDRGVLEVVDARWIVELSEDRLDAGRLDLGDAAGPDGKLHVFVGRVTDGG